MGNCIFAFPDRVLPTPQVTPVLSGGVWLPALPLTNLQDTSDTRMSTIARSASADVSSTMIQGSFGTTRDIRVFAMCRHNASPDATVQLQLFSDGDCNTMIADTGDMPVWATFYPPGALAWGHPSFWTGAISEEDRKGYAFDFYYAFGSAVLCQGFKVFIRDATNPDGYFQLARCILASGWQPQFNFQWGSGLQWKDPSVVNKSLGGVKFFTRKKMYRGLTGKLNYMTNAQGVGAWFEMQRRLGITEEIFFVYDPDDVYQAMKLRSFLCTMRELSPLENPFFNSTSAAFALEELL